jgi:hypothetical protein
MFSYSLVGPNAQRVVDEALFEALHLQHLGHLVVDRREVAMDDSDAAVQLNI